MAVSLRCHQKLKNQQPSKTNIQDQLYDAINNGDVAEVEHLFKQRVDVNTKFRLGETCLHIAVLKSKNIDLVKMLLQYGADVNAEDILAQTPIYLAVTKGDRNILDGLIKLKYIYERKNVYYDVNGIKSEMPDYSIIEDGTLEIIECLINHGASVNVESRNPEKYTPISLLHLATYRGNVDMVKLFLKHGVDINSSHIKIGTSLFVAVYTARVEVVKCLLENGANVFYTLSEDALEGVTPLHAAISSGDEEVVKVLVNHILGNIPKDDQGRTLLHYLVENQAGIPYNLMTLKESVSSSFFFRKKEETSRYTKLVSLYDYVIGTYIENDIEVNSKDKNGVTPFQVAVDKGYFEFAKLLLKYGADIDAKYEEGKTALHLAIIKDHAYLTETLLKFEANIFAVDNDGQTPMDYVNGDSSYEIKRIFKMHGNQMEFLHMNEEDLRLSFDDDNRNNFEKKYAKEVIDLREMKVCDSMNDTFCDILTKPLHKLIVYARNQNIIRAIETNDFEEFPIYGEFLKNRFARGKFRNELVYSSIKAFNSLVNKDYPDFVSEEIFSYLSNEDIRNIVIVHTLPIVEEDGIEESSPS